MKKTGLLLLVALVLTGASLNDARKANEAYNNGNYAEAEQLYKKAIDADPDNAKLYFNLGNALVNQGKHEEALRVFEEFKTMTDNPQQQALANYNIGNIYTATKKWDKALNSFKKALRYREADEDAKHNYELAKRKKEEQEQQKKNQQNQQNDQNQDKQDQQQQQNQQNRNNQNQQQQQQNQQNNQQNQNQSQQNNSSNQQQDQQQPNRISKGQAEKILQALEQKEKDLLKEFKKKKTESSNSENEKDW